VEIKKKDISGLNCKPLWLKW